MASPADFVPHDHDADAAGGSGEYALNFDLEEENFQGPHPWRQRLRPVPRLIAEKDEESEEQESGRAGNSSERSFSNSTSDQDDSPRSHRSRDPNLKKDMMKKRRNRFLNRSANGSAASQIPVFSLHKRRPTVTSPESPFTLQVVNATTTAPGPPRKRSSPSNSFRQSGPPSRRNTQTNIDPIINSEVTKKRVERVQRARLYLLQQTGPNSFLIGGDSPDHKFRVIIGPQSCSCGRGPHCVHVLFVMLRVFQVSENDPCLWSRTLKNYEVENLFRIYYDKRTSRLNNQRDSPNKSLKTDQEETENTTDGKEETSTVSSDVETGSTREEEDTCPICLLEMLEGESLIRCENGCQNRLHHHCIAVWFEECRRQAEPLICPLCRAHWKSNTVEIKISQDQSAEPPEAPPNTRAPSPQTVATESQSRLPHAEPIPPDQQATAAPWIEVLGEDLVSCLFSRNWSVRESGLRHLSQELVGTLLRGLGEGRSGARLSPSRQATTHAMLETCCNVLAYMCADPVYRVFVASLRAIRTMMSYTPCRDEAQKARLQALLKPIVDAIILKCTDGNKRTSQLSLSTLMELAKGQNGELAVGKEIVDPGTQGLDGLSYVLRCATEDYSMAGVQWQWLLGRLHVLDRMIDEFPNELVPESAGAEAEAASPPGDAGAASAACPKGESPESGAAPPPLLSIAKFCVQAVCSSHIRIARMSRRVFLLVAKLGAHFENIVTQLFDLLKTVNTNCTASLRRKVARIVDEFQLSDRIVHELHHGTRKNLLHTVHVDSPIPTPDDTPSPPPDATRLSRWVAARCGSASLGLHPTPPSIASGAGHGELFQGSWPRKWRTSLPRPHHQRT